MQDEGRRHQEEEQLHALVKAFEAMMKAGESKFFDHDELEWLIEHFLEKGSVSHCSVPLLILLPATE